MSDLVDLIVTGLGAFFVVLSVVLLARYRQASQEISSSSERTHDIWQALQERLKRQDERIIDLMSRVEVLQARAVAPTPSNSLFSVMPRDVTLQQQAAQQRYGAPSKPRVAEGGLGDTEMTVVELLGTGSKSTIEIKDATGLSREHTARTMKGLFDKGFVTRDESEKPFVYRLAEAGRRLLSSS